VKGNVNDERIQYLLTYALEREQNPGVRLRAVNTIGANKKASADPEIKKALISALKSDGNDGVRKEAMAVLKTYPFDSDIRNAFVYVLQRDANAALRIDAIKSLEENKIQDKELLTVLKEKSESDDNSYIRRRATNILQEVSQQ
ncbi:MAG TPA: HEAT repeat domain-containing protein, partial [Acidobacteriota bacterium]